MLEPGKTAPFVVGGTPVRQYTCANYLAVLNRDIRSVGPIEYLYILVVFRSANLESPIMFVTAERNTLGAQSVSVMPEELRKEMGPDFGKSLFIGVFDESGHSNLGMANECADIEVFTARALTVAKMQLKLRQSFEVERDSPSSVQQYLNQFERLLLSALKELPLSEDVDDLYPLELRRAYAGAGQKLGVPIGKALMYMMFTHSSNMREFQRPPSWWDRQFSESAKRKDALIKAHTGIRNCFIDGAHAEWDHATYPAFLAALGGETSEVLKGYSKNQLERLAEKFWMTKTPDLAGWKELAERALL